MRTVASKIFLTFVVGLVAFGLVAAFAARRVHGLGRDLRFLSEGYLPLTRIAAQLEVKEWVASRALDTEPMEPQARRAWMAVARAQFPEVVREKIAEGRAVVARMRALAAGPDEKFLGEVAARLDGLDARWGQYDGQAAALFAAIERGGAEARGAALTQRVQQLRTLEKALSLDVKLLQVSLDAQVADRVHAAERTESRTGALIVIYSALAAAVGSLAVLVAHRLLRPIRTLTEGVKAVAAGDLARKVEVRSGDEIGLLAREFNAMAASLARQRAELLRAERLAAVGRISAQITHEIRNPLNAIGLNAELLAEEISGSSSAEAQGLLAAIGREVDRLNGVTEEYLRFARLPKPVFAREDVNEIVSGLAEFLAPEMAAARVELRLELALKVPVVRADEGQLRAAFLNLLRNSREAMPVGGMVSLATRAAAEGGVEVEVRDTGSGICAEDLGRIFDPFYSTKEKGNGLGLAFAQQVVMEHRGSIRCESEVGRGTVFTVRLPGASPETSTVVSQEKQERVEAASA
ncbi:MAG: ATP-binding protein [Anaeromyxobacteraceae bacterium]